MTGGDAEAPTLNAGPEDAFCEAVLKGSSDALDGGGALPDTERAIPDYSFATGSPLMAPHGGELQPNWEPCPASGLTF